MHTINDTLSKTHKFKHVTSVNSHISLLIRETVEKTKIGKKQKTQKFRSIAFFFFFLRKKAYFN